MAGRGGDLFPALPAIRRFRGVGLLAVRDVGVYTCMCLGDAWGGYRE